MDRIKKMTRSEKYEADIEELREESRQAIRAAFALYETTCNVVYARFRARLDEIREEWKEGEKK